MLTLQATGSPIVYVQSMGAWVVPQALVLEITAPIAIVASGKTMRFILHNDNLEAVNRLGQLLHHTAQRDGDDLVRYRQAAALLSRVTFIDDRARLFHGWSSLRPP
jgi:hypothetical protein